MRQSAALGDIMFGLQEVKRRAILAKDNIVQTLEDQFPLLGTVQEQPRAYRAWYK